MSVRNIATRGFGNGTFAGTIALVVLRGFHRFDWLREATVAGTWAEESTATGSWTEEGTAAGSWTEETGV